MMLITRQLLEKAMKAAESRGTFEEAVLKTYDAMLGWSSTDRLSEDVLAELHRLGFMHHHKIDR